MRHSYTYENKTLNPLRLTLLAIAFISDLVNIFMIPSAIFNPINFLWIAIVFLAMLGVRIATVYMTYEIEYSYYQGVLKVNKVFYRKPYVFIEIDKQSIQSIVLYNSEDVEAKRLYSKTCVHPLYLVTTKNNEKYVLALDDTMYAALTCEDKYDLFR